MLSLQNISRADPEKRHFKISIRRIMPTYLEFIIKTDRKADIEKRNIEQ